MKQLSYITLLVTTMSILVIGCGGGSDSSPSTNTNDTLSEYKGYYVDASVKGVDYNCGKYTGSTDTEGSFFYEDGKECSFSIADIELRNISAENLENGVTIFENNLDTARFLQSVDIDGDATNGIEISSNTHKAIEKESNSSIPTGARLETVFASIDTSDASFTGHIPSSVELETHLILNLRELLGGKIYYAYDTGEGIPTVYSITFNDDLSSVVINQRDYPSGEHPETRVVNIDILGVNSLRLSGDEETTIVVEGSLSTIRLLSFPHNQLLDILYTSEAAAVDAG